VSCSFVYSEPPTPQDVRRDYAEAMSAWLQRSTDGFAAQGRSWINQMYSQFPDPNHILRGNLLARDDASFWGAVTSLAVFDKLVSRGRTVVNDESVEGQDRRPDLQIEPGTESETVIECTALLDDQESAARDTLLAPLMDELDRRLQGSDWFVHLEPIGDFMENPPPRRIADAITGDMANAPGGLMFQRTYPQWNLKVHFFASESGTSRTRPVGGCTPFDSARCLNDDERILDKLAQKSPRYYGVTSVPFALALAPLYTFYDRDEILDVLYDRRCGYYGQPGSSRRVLHSGVIVVEGVRQLGADPVVLSLLPNPDATFPINPELACVDRAYNPASGQWSDIDKAV